MIYYIDLIQYLIMIIQICYYCRRSGTVALVVINFLCIPCIHTLFTECHAIPSAPVFIGALTSTARCDCQVPSLQVLVTAPNLRRGAFHRCVLQMSSTCHACHWPRWHVLMLATFLVCIWLLRRAENRPDK